MSREARSDLGVKQITLAAEGEQIAGAAPNVKQRAQVGVCAMAEGTDGGTQQVDSCKVGQEDKRKRRRQFQGFWPQ